MHHYAIKGLTVAASLTLIGCGGGSSDTTTSETGYFIDAPVQNLLYQTASGIVNTTDIYGRFQFKENERVEFRIGNLILGEAVPNADGLMTPELLYPNDEVHKALLLQTLQALDTDHNLTNGITIPDTLLEEIDPISFEDLNETEILVLNNGELATFIDRDYDGTIDIDPTQAENHFRESMNLWGYGHRPDENLTDNSYLPGYLNGGTATTIDIFALPASTLTQELKDAIAHMGNEERLAYDIYMNLYSYHLAYGDQINQLQNIATRSEQTHVNIVQSLVEKYSLTSEDLSDITSSIADSNTSLTDMPSGTYALPAIQTLYDALYTKGTVSVQDALEVGCMVEVTDIDDLDRYITLAEETNASDVKEAFEVLKEGSYNHYWAFDKGLKNRGITEGCCSLGIIDGIDYCHSEYP